ncbi:hypothetical protein QC764_106265 [Podospora pseudoanserina]|uniref:Uncharacterized protein n=1 Tax=Podospora pseudoanserina TaxID=2609844 RepID=A0ABR0ILN6_9PEZI|nr:hypothetical protein QC764_106265 [Podospora pseudoanserina]
MARLMLLLLSAIAAVGISAQSMAGAEDEAQRIYSLSCVLYRLNMGAYAKIVPILNELADDFAEGIEISKFKPALDPEDPTKVTTGNDIENNVGRATNALRDAFQVIANGGGATNLCEVAPAIGKDISTALKELKQAAVTYYFVIINYNPIGQPGLQRAYLSFNSGIDAAIEAPDNIIEF